MTQTLIGPAPAPGTATTGRAHFITPEADRATHGGPEVIVFEHWSGWGVGVQRARAATAPGQDMLSALYMTGWRLVRGAELEWPATGYVVVDVERVPGRFDDADPIDLQDAARGDMTPGT